MEKEKAEDHINSETEDSSKKEEKVVSELETNQESKEEQTPEA